MPHSPPTMETTKKEAKEGGVVRIDATKWVDHKRKRMNLLAVYRHHLVFCLAAWEPQRHSTLSLLTKRTAAC